VDLDGSGTVNFDEFLFVVAKIRSQSQSSSQRIQKGASAPAVERDTLTLKELIESKIPDKLVNQGQTPVVEKRSIAERKEEAVAARMKAKKKKHNQIMPGETHTSLSTVVLPPLSPSANSSALVATGERSMVASGTPRAQAQLDSPRAAAKAKMKAASKTLRGAELLVRTPKMPAGLPMKGTGRPAVLTSTQKDLVKAINKGQKGPKRKRKVAKGEGMASTQEPAQLGASGVRKLKPKKVTKGSGTQG